jgi:hypothetical protein
MTDSVRCSIAAASSRTYGGAYRDQHPAPIRWRTHLSGDRGSQACGHLGERVLANEPLPRELDVEVVGQHGGQPPELRRLLRALQAVELELRRHAQGFKVPHRVCQPLDLRLDGPRILGRRGGGLLLLLLLHGTPFENIHEERAFGRQAA